MKQAWQQLCYSCAVINKLVDLNCPPFLQLDNVGRTEIRMGKSSNCIISSNLWRGWKTSPCVVGCLLWRCLSRSKTLGQWASGLVLAAISSNFRYPYTCRTPCLRGAYSLIYLISLSQTSSSARRKGNEEWRLENVGQLIVLNSYSTSNKHHLYHICTKIENNLFLIWKWNLVYHQKLMKQQIRFSGIHSINPIIFLW